MALVDDVVQVFVVGLCSRGNLDYFAFSWGIGV